MRNSGSETGPVPTKSSQSPLRIRSVQVEGVEELGNEEVTSNEVPMTIQGEAQCICSTDMCWGKVVPGQKYSQMVTLSQLDPEPQSLNQQARF